MSDAPVFLSGRAVDGTRHQPGRLLRRAAWGGLALAGGQALGKGASFLAMLVLARLLTPEDFGVAGMATVMLGFVATFSDLGLTAALIQRRELTAAHKDAAFWSSALMGAVLFALIASAAPWIADFYRDRRVTWVAIAAACSLLIGPLWSTHTSLLRRELELGVVAKAELLRGIAGSVAAIAGAFAGLGYFAIVLGPLVGQLVATPMLWHAQRYRPRLRASREHAGQLYSFSLFVAGASAVNYLSANVDYLIIGRALGPVALGTYMLAYQLVTFPLSRISSLFHQVMFPAFSNIQDDLASLQSGYLGVHRSVALITLPIVGLFAVIAPELVRALYGDQWVDAAPILRLLAVAGGAKSVGTLVGIVFKSRGKPEVELYWNLAWCVAVTVAVSLGIRGGTHGVALAISLLCIPGVLYTEWLACAYLGLPLRRLLGVLVLPVLATLVSVLVGLTSRPIVEGFFEGATDGLVLRLVMLSLVTLATYAAMLWGANPWMGLEVRAFAAHFRRSH